MPLPFLSIAQMREWEKATWAASHTEAEIIARVGEKVAARVRQIVPPGSKILLLAGRGHNGDDVRAAQSHLPNYEVVLQNVTAPAALSHHPFSHYDLIVDGLFGIGLNRPLDESWQKLIRAINHSTTPILSIDVPSGLNADTGEAQGAAIRATVTLAMGAPKRGLHFATATEFVGRLEVVTGIGLLPCPATDELSWVLPEDFTRFPSPRSVVSHKGCHGHLAIIAGSLGYHGAAVLAARGALRAQPGLVSLFTPENVFLPVAAQLQAVMVHPWSPQSGLPESASAILYGPGLAAKELSADWKNEFCADWLESTRPIVADASALDWLPPGKTPKNALRVITPHPGEAARLLQTSSRAIQSDRAASVRALSNRYGGCWVVLKGHQTLVGKSAGELSVNSSGNPFLGQGGSGDVLAGYLAGWLAQPDQQYDVRKTITFAVWQHGTIADALSASQKNWTVDDLVQALGNGSV